MNGHESRTRAAGSPQKTDGVMPVLENAPEPGLERRQQAAKQSLLGSKRSHSSGHLSEDSESRTEQSHHDQRQRRRGGFACASDVLQSDLVASTVCRHETRDERGPGGCRQSLERGGTPQLSCRT